MKWSSQIEEAAYYSAVLDNPRKDGEKFTDYLERIGTAAKELLARKAQPHEWKGEL